MKKGLLALLFGFCFAICSCNVPGAGDASSNSSSSSNITNSSSSVESSPIEDESSNSASTSSSNSSQMQNSSPSEDSSIVEDSTPDNSSDASSEDSSKPEDSSSSAPSSSSDSSSPVEDAGCDEHVDEDDNGVCDECKAGVLATFDFYAINDIHGKMADGDSHPGVDELTTYLKQARENNPNTVLLSSGDTWQGMSESNLTKGFILTEWMNEMDFASMTLGNHEYDWGEEVIEANAELAQFPFLAINVYDSTTNQLESYCQPSVLIEQNGVKIGIIGAIGDCYSSISGDKSSGFYFKTGNALTQLVKAESEKLRAEGADFIVYSIHDGYGRSFAGDRLINDSDIASYYDVALSKGYVDVVFEAHSHQSYVMRDSAGVYHLQGGGDNDGISHARFEINFANETYKAVTAKYIASSTYVGLDGDPLVDQILDKYADQIAISDKVLGYNESYRSSSELTDKIAQLYYEAGLERWGDEYEIVLGGGFLSARSPYDLGIGDVTYGTLQGIFPFDNQIVLCSVSGAKLRDKFFETSNGNYHIYYDSYGAEVRNNLHTNGIYYIVTDTYTSTYAPNGLTEVARYDETTFARDLLAAYIEKGGYGSKGEVQYSTIPEILAIGGALSYNESTTTAYTVKGTVKAVHSTKWGNMTIADENGNTLYIYGTYDATGKIRYDAMEQPPQVGDAVVLSGVICNYYNSNTGENKIEIKNACLVAMGEEELPGGSNTPDGPDDTDTPVEPSSDPYTTMTAAEFYANYKVATSAQDAYYRSLHGFMSGELTVPDQAPTISNYQPMYNNQYVRNSAMQTSADGLSYTVLDAYGNQAFVVFKGGAYITLEEVAAYVYAFGEPPANYSASKNTDPDDSIWGEYLRVNHTKFSGDTSRYPYEPVLPNISGCGGTLYYYEMDIGTTGTDCDPKYDAAIYNDGHDITRGAARIVYAKNDLDGDGVYEVGEHHVFYTYNHYNDFQEYLNYEGGWGEMFGNITGGGSISSKYDYNPTDYVDIYMGFIGSEYEISENSEKYALTGKMQEDVTVFYGLKYYVTAKEEWNNGKEVVQVV